MMIETSGAGRKFWKIEAPYLLPPQLVTLISSRFPGQREEFIWQTPSCVYLSVSQSHTDTHTQSLHYREFCVLYSIVNEKV